MSLHWILALTLTLLHCLTALPIKPFDFNDIQQNINKLKDIGCHELDSTFYTHSGENNCIIEALDCSMVELEKFTTECTNKIEDIQIVNRTRVVIKHVLERNSITLNDNSNNCFCGEERPEEQPHDKFIENIRTLFQKLNSRA